jgi:hypothetical protein
VLKAGSNFLLLSQGAKPEKIRVAYKQDSLVWHPSDPSKRIPVSVKLALTVGTEDPAFASVKGRQGIDDENCFSLFYGDSGVMFLAAEDGNVLANWLVGVNHLQGCAAAGAPSSTEADDFTQRLNRASVSYQTAPEQKAFSSSSTLQTVSETGPAVGNDALQAAFAEQSKALQLMIQAQISQSLASLVVGENKIVDPAALELDAHTELELLKITLEEYSATIEAQQNTITKLKDQLAQKDKQSKAFETRVTQLVRKNSMDSLQGGRERTASFDQLETFAV